MGLFETPHPRCYPFPSEPKDWTPDMKWEKGLFLKAKSYQPDLLYDKDTKKGRFIYTNKLLPKGKALQIYKGRQEGGVKFDDDIWIPSIFEHKIEGRNPWMSLTPNELITLRGGTRRARGHVIVAGLGLGYQLTQVMKRRQVEHVTIVEREQDVVDLVLPKLKLAKSFDLIIDDAEKVLPKLSADVALIDIFENYGYNVFRPKCPSIPTIWCWGTRA